jgi:hypothetical protein
LIHSITLSWIPQRSMRTMRIAVASNVRVKFVEKKGPFTLIFCQVVALVFPHRSIFTGLLLVANLFPPFLKRSWLSHRKKRATAEFTEEI